MSSDGKTNRKRLSLLRSSLFLCFLCFVALSIVGQGWATLYEKGAFERWTQLSLPPGQPAHLRFEVNTILLEMADGRLFEWDWLREPPWAEMETLPDPAHPLGGFWTCQEAEDNRFYWVRPSPEPVRERVRMGCGGADAGAYYEFVLLQNAQVWYWGHGATPRSAIIVRIPVCGVTLLASLAIGTVISEVLRRKERDRAEGGEPPRG